MVQCEPMQEEPLTTVTDAFSSITDGTSEEAITLNCQKPPTKAWAGVQEGVEQVNRPRADSSGPFLGEAPDHKQAPDYKQMQDPAPPMSAVASIMALAQFGVAFCCPFLLWWALQMGILVYVCRRTAPEDLRVDVAALPKEDFALLLGFILMAIVNLFRRIYRYGSDCGWATSVLNAYRSWNAKHDSQRREGWPLRLRLVTCFLVLAMVIQGIAVVLFALCIIFLMLTTSSTSDPTNLVLLSQVVVLACVLEFDNGFAQRISNIVSDAQHEIMRLDDATTNTPSQYTGLKIHDWDDAVFQAMLGDLPDPQVEPSGCGSSLAPPPCQCRQVAGLSSTERSGNRDHQNDRDEQINGSSNV